MKQVLICIYISFLVLSGCVNKEVVNNEKPNVLFIFPDQMRRYSSGYWSEEPFRQFVVGKPDPVVTPNIDKLAKQGVVFTNAISNYPLCSPYRGMLLTGMYPESNGIWGNCRKGRTHQLNKDIPAITDLFYNAGYTTSYFGKCHWEKTEPLFDSNGNYKGTTEKPGGEYVNKYDTYVPNGLSRHSIEYFYQSLKDNHFNPLVYSNDPKTIDGKVDGELHKPHVFSAKNEANHIINYLKNTHNQRDDNKPFFMIWSLNPPHNPWDDENTDMPVLEEFYDKDKYNTVDELVKRNNADPKVAHYARHYFANITSVDNYVGEVLNQLDELGQLDNTIVVFSSDHGEMLGSHHLTGKNVLKHEALAIPFIVHWPNGIEPSIVDDIFGVTDVLPTIMNLAGLKYLVPNDIQGTDYSKRILHNKSTKAIVQPELILLGSARGIMNDRFTLCIEEDKNVIVETYLYDNAKDPYQLQKLRFEERKDEVQALLLDLGRLLKFTNDPWYQQKKYEDLIPYPEDEI